MEKWRCKGKSTVKATSNCTVTNSSSSSPQTASAAAQAQSPSSKQRDPRLNFTMSSAEKKKEKKWSFGGLLKKRISKNDTTENSIIGNYTSENHHLTKTAEPNVIHSRCRRNEYQENIYNNIQSRNVEYEDSINSYGININLNNKRYSLESSSSNNLVNKNSRKMRIKTRIQAKRGRCDDSSSDEEINSKIIINNNNNNANKNNNSNNHSDISSNNNNNNYNDNNKLTNTSLMRIQSEDSINYNNHRNDINSKRTRGARTERYMKRLYREDINGSNGHHHHHHDLIKHHMTTPTDNSQLCKSRKKYLNDNLSSSLWPISTDDIVKEQLCRKSTSSSPAPQTAVTKTISPVPRYYQSYCSEQNLVNTFPGRHTDTSIDLCNSVPLSCYSDKYTWPQSRRSKATPINWNKSSQLDDVTNYQVDKVQPPVPPPRSSKSRLFATPIRFSLQNSDIDNQVEQNNQLTSLFHNNNNNNSSNNMNNVNNTSNNNNNSNYYKYNNNSKCNSLDRIRMPRNYSKSHVKTQVPEFNRLRCASNMEVNSRMNLSPVNDSKINENPIVPKIKQSQLFADSRIIDDNATANQELERKRHSKNLEEALLELETIYNSLRLSDEDLLDRAEQRSMEEYRDRVATTAIEGSIKSSSDTSSSYELNWRHANFDRCHGNDTRLKDDMAYRRMHQNDRPPSVDPTQSSLSRVSYLAASPVLGYRCEMDYITDSKQPKTSRRSTPDLIHDDVAFRSITHANNTLKVIDPQPPFGIPLGPVTAASESDYLHVEPTRESHLRSLYIPKTEPDVVTDDLAYRNLRKDATSKDKSSSSSLICNNMNFLSHTSGLTTTLTPKKKRAVRSLSADLYGVIDKNSDNHAWYKEYVKLNRPYGIYRNAERLNSDDTNSWINNREYCDVDINGNRPKSMYQGRIQVCIPQEDEMSEKSLEIHQRQMLETNKRTTLPSSTSMLSSCCDNNTANEKSIEAFSDQELSEYQQLCRDLESLIKKTSEKVKCMETKSDTESRKNSLSEFIEWEKLLNQNDTRLEDKRIYEASKLIDEHKDEISIKEDENMKYSDTSMLDKEHIDSQGNFLSDSEVEEILQSNDNDNVDKEHNNKNNNDNNKLLYTKMETLSYEYNMSDDSHDKTIDATDNASNLEKNLTTEDNDFQDDHDDVTSTTICKDTDEHCHNNSSNNNNNNKDDDNNIGLNSKTNNESVLLYKATVTSPLLSGHKDQGKIKNTSKNSEGRETTQ